MYKVLEVANKLGVSKVTVYKKIKQHAKELKGHIITKGKIQYLDEEALRMISNTISKNEVPDSADVLKMKEQKVILRHQLEQKTQLKESKMKLIAEYKRMLKSVRGKILYFDRTDEKKG